jgi:hypothetical protein
MEVDEKGDRVKKAAIVGILISILSIVLIFNITGTSITWKMIFQTDWKFLSIALFFHFLFWFFWAVRLKLLASFLNHKVSFGYAFETTLASTFLAAITPSSAGGEPLRVKMLVDRGASVGSASAIVLTERLLDAIFFVSALPIFLILSNFSMKFGFEVVLAFLVFLLGFILFLCIILKKPERIDKIVVKLYPILRKFLGKRAEKVCKHIQNEFRMFRDAAVELARNSLNQLMIVMFLTSLIWITEFAVPSALLMALKEDPSLLLSITSQLIIVIVSLVPITPGSSGIAEAGMAYLYSKFVPHHALSILVALWRATTYFSNLLVGFFVNVKILKYRYINRG